MVTKVALTPRKSLGGTVTINYSWKVDKLISENEKKIKCITMCQSNFKVVTLQRLTSKF